MAERVGLVFPVHAAGPRGVAMQMVLGALVIGQDDLEGSGHGVVIPLLKIPVSGRSDEEHSPGDLSIDMNGIKRVCGTSR